MAVVTAVLRFGGLIWVLIESFGVVLDVGETAEGEKRQNACWDSKDVD